MNNSTTGTVQAQHPAHQQPSEYHHHCQAFTAPPLPSAQFLEGSNNESVIIGSGRDSWVMPKVTYKAVLKIPSVVSGQKLVLKLLDCVFLPEELSLFNYRGGNTVHKDGQVIAKKCLEHELRYRAIVCQAEKEFPGSTTGEKGSALKLAVRNKCNKSVKKNQHLWGKSPIEGGLQ